MIIFIYGQDTFRSRKKLKELKNKFIREVDPNGNSLVVLDGQTINLEQINEKASPRSLLTKKRMVIIEDIFLNKNKTIFADVYNYFKKQKPDKDDNIIIFWDSRVKTKKTSGRESRSVGVIVDSADREKPLPQKSSQLFNFLSKQKYAQEFKLLSSVELSSWAKKEIEARGGQATHQAVQLLTSLIGNDLWQIDNEINKLINYKLGREPKLTAGGKPVPIEASDVEQLVRGNFDENIFALTDHLSNKNKVLAAKLLEEQYEAGLTDSYLINMIVRQFRILLQIRQALDSGFTSRKIISLLKLHPFIVQKGISQARNFTLVDLKGILIQLTKIDYLMKTGQEDAKIGLNLFISKI